MRALAHARIENVILYGLVTLLVAAIVMQIPKALKQEAVFNDNIRKARCERHWESGYCGYQEARQ